MSTLVHGGRGALHYLWRFGLLGEHPRTRYAFDEDRGTLDLDALDLDTWPWSSGERILVGIASGIATGYCDVKVTDLWRLDEDQRTVAASALSIWWNRSSIGDYAEVGL
jgi:hypothetical protein